MRKPKHAPLNFRNNVLSALTSADRELLRPHLKPIEFELRHSFFVANKPIKEVFFPESGFASVVATTASGHSIEVGMIGREGVVGIPIALGEEISPYDSYAQAAGHGYAMNATVLWTVMKKSWPLADVMLRAASTFLYQVTHSALANGRFTIEQRLARWLLMAQDRVESDVLLLTHDFLSMMLGVRRPGVTLALQLLESTGSIAAKPGRITIKDRTLLVGTAGDCYGQPESDIAHPRA